MAYIKRLAMPKTWPFARKGSIYVVRPLPGRNLNKCIPLSLAIRHLEIAKTTKEVKFILNTDKVKVNSKVIKEKSAPVGLFDTISFPYVKKNFRLVIKNKKLFLLPIKEEEAKIKPARIIKKTSLKGNKFQVNLDDGTNVISSTQCNVGDTFVFDLEKKSIIQHLKFEKGALGYLLGGKYLGELAKINEIEGKNISCTIISEENKKTSVLKKHIFVIGKEKPVISLK